MNTESLIDRNRQQMELPLPTSDQMDDAYFLKDEAGDSREFTGARLFSKHPETYKAIVALSAEGLGAIRIGRILAVSPNTVLAVRAREVVNVDIEKKRISDLSRAAARMCVEGIIEMLSDPYRSKDMSLRDRGIVFGILAEKAELLSGAPTARIAVDSSDVELSEYLRWLRSEHAKQQTGLEEEKRVEKVVDAEVVETPAKAVLAGPSGAQVAGQADAYPVGSEGLVAAPSGSQVAGQADAYPVESEGLMAPRGAQDAGPADAYPVESEGLMAAPRPVQAPHGTAPHRGQNPDLDPAARRGQAPHHNAQGIDNQQLTRS